jgi:Adenylyl/Guanylyl and SMODS C-terminal sensor domain
MRKNNINQLLRSYVKENLTPTMDDIQFVSNIYQSFNDLLGVNNCVQIGSYPRYTAIKPLHDLDILYIMGEWNSKQNDPKFDLKSIADNFLREYVNPTTFKLDIVVQTHSISFRYLDKEEEAFAVDIVPALTEGKNEFYRNTFRVPEIIKIHRGKKRAEYYERKIQNKENLTWIKTDPLGYIEVASNVNKQNEDFRRSVKFIKRWKHECKEKNENFKLKSFHLEQLITENYKSNINLDIFDSIFKCLSELKEKIQNPILRDRGDTTKFIDSYVSELTENERGLIHQAVDAILIAFENIDNINDLNRLVKSGYYWRIAGTEKFLFDQKIPVLIDDSVQLKIDGFVWKAIGFREYKANLKYVGGIVDTKNAIDFKITSNNTYSDIVKWKVKNDNNSSEVRGEITDFNTPGNPEKTAYIGRHFVECYSIKSNVCIAKDRVDVVVRQ